MSEPTHGFIRMRPLTLYHVPRPARIFRIELLPCSLINRLQDLFNARFPRGGSFLNRYLEQLFVSDIRVQAV